MKRRFGLIGYPLSHSFSRKYFTDKFLKKGLDDHSYENFEISSIDQFPGIFDREDISGLNVTIPYKEEVIPYLDKLDETARKVGAVNVIRVENGIKTGYNSDLYGFLNSLKSFLDRKIDRALILGTGGASKAVVAALDTLEITCQMVSRTPDQDQISYQEANRQLDQSDLIVNTTPLGMSPNVDSRPDLDYSKIGTSHFLYDLIYNPEVTKFLRSGQENGARIKNGFEMLKLQAERSWEIWNY